MKCRALGFLLAAGVCSGQVSAIPDHYIEIKLPPIVKSETFFARFIFAGQDFGDWIQPRSGVTSYVLSTMIEGHPAIGIKAIFYAPGCAIQTLDIPLSDSENPRYSFICQPVKNIPIDGTIVRFDRIYDLDVQLQAKYVAHWAQKFLELDRGILTAIPVGSVASISEDGRFHLEVPDFSEASEHPAELQIWATKKTSGAIMAKLIPRGEQPVGTQFGGLKVQNEYLPEIVFSPCTYLRRHDQWGFAIRPPTDDPCER